jgi:hypothetical protein
VIVLCLIFPRARKKKSVGAYCFAIMQSSKKHCISRRISDFFFGLSASLDHLGSVNSVHQKTMHLVRVLTRTALLLGTKYTSCEISLNYAGNTIPASPLSTFQAASTRAEQRSHRPRTRVPREAIPVPILNSSASPPVPLYLSHVQSS